MNFEFDKKRLWIVYFFEIEFDHIVFVDDNQMSNLAVVQITYNFLILGNDEEISYLGKIFQS